LRCSPVSVPFDLTCWYLNARRIAEITGVTPIAPLGATDPHSARTAQLIQLKNAAVAWMKANGATPLEVLLAEGKLAPGAIFTHHSNFFFSGLSKVAEARRKGTPVKKPATAYSKLDESQSGGRLEFEFHDEHLVSESSWHELAGQQRKFVLGLVTDIQGGTIKCVPYVIANIVNPHSPLQGDGGAWYNHLEVHVSQIDSFDKAHTIQDRLTKASLNALEDVPEAAIKTAFAEIINEPMVPKDWGGEASDLFSSRVVLEGKRISTAFLLKGPAKFHPMTPADLGKNGDQIGRLFSEPADLLILQHCHEVTVAVRRQMRAYAQQMGNPRRFCIIDGYDTLRVLKAYGKCGFSVDDAVRSGTS
jgi:hypothetical protein